METFKDGKRGDECGCEELPLKSHTSDSISKRVNRKMPFVL